MRILLDATPLQTGHRQRGVGTYTRELLRSLLAVDRENDYRLLAHPPHRSSQAVLLAELGELPANARIVLLPQPALGRFTGFVTHQVLLPRLLARTPVDLFHSPGFVAAFSVPGVPWRCPLPLVVTLHDFIPLHLPELSLHRPINRAWYAWQRRVASQADALICVSEATRQDALRFVAAPAERCVVVSEGVDRRIFHPAIAERQGDDPLAANSARLLPNAPFILFVGGNFANKNRPAALAAFTRLTQATTLPHHLVMVGEDATTEAQLVERTPGLDWRRLHRIQHVTQAELAQLYRQADAFLFPSTHEGFGLPVLEAMASGVPVIASNTSSVPEVAGDAALLVDPHDVDAIAAALGRVLADAVLRSHLRQAGLARAAEFTWEAMALQTLAVYRRVAQHQTRSAAGTAGR